MNVKNITHKQHVIFVVLALTACGGPPAGESLARNATVPEDAVRVVIEGPPKQTEPLVAPEDVVAQNTSNDAHVKAETLETQLIDTAKDARLCEKLNRRCIDDIGYTIHVSGPKATELIVGVVALLVYS